MAARSLSILTFINMWYAIVLTLFNKQQTRIYNNLLIWLFLFSKSCGNKYKALLLNMCLRMLADDCNPNISENILAHQLYVLRLINVWLQNFVK